MLPIRHWLSRFKSKSEKVSTRKSTRNRRIQTLAVTSESLEQRVLLSAATVTQFSGGDAGDGLDLSGTFKYAIDFGAPSTLAFTAVRDAKFTSGSTSGLTYNARQVISNYVAPTYGSGQNDRGLATVMASIVHSAPNGDMQIGLAGVLPGVNYKLQLMFADASSVRGFDIKVEGGLILDDFNPSVVQGAGQSNAKGVVVTYEFLATDDTVNIELNGSTTTFADKNSIINALTLEELRPVGTTSISTFTGGDVGEGLDLDGTFVYAIDYGAPTVPPQPPQQVRDATFLGERERPGYASTTTDARSAITNYLSANYGTSQNDTRLATVMNSIVHNSEGGVMLVSLPGVTPGVAYKLQLLFGDQVTSRGFDVSVEGALIKDEFNPGTVQGAGQYNSKGVVLTYEFVATDDTVNIVFNGAAANFLDKNPILNGLTLEDTRPKVTFGSVVNPTEGFGYGSTIAGLGGAIDATQSAQALDGSFTKSLGTAETGQFTTEGWLYPKPGVTEGVVWNYAENYKLFRVNDTGLRLVLFRSGASLPGTHFDITVNNVLNADAWNHLAATFDGDVLRLFVNGVEVITAPDTLPEFAVTRLVNITVARFQGTLTATDPQGAAGMLDELRVWNIARTQAEVQETALQKLTGTEPGLAAYWDFDHPGPVDPTTGKSNTELDSTGGGNFLNVSADRRRENAAPQIGYVDVVLNQPVTSPLGLFVTYSLSTNSAIADVDYYSSRFRKVSTDPNSERNGIIIPQGESSGRIYFMARADAIFDPDETITVAATPFSFRGLTGLPDYLIGSGNSANATLKIADSGAYKPGVSVTDVSGRPVSANYPLYINPAIVLAEFYVQLTSQPTGPVLLLVDTQSSSGPLTVARQFNTDNWNVPQLVRLPAASNTGAMSVTAASYLSTPLSIPFTKIAPPVGLVQEGNATDLTPVKPTVSMGPAVSVNEDEDTPAKVQILLNVPAPAGGLDVRYGLLAGGTARIGVNYQPITGVVHVDEGLVSANIPIFPIDDQIDQGTNLSVTLLLVSDSTYTLGSTSQATVTIVNDDQARISIANPAFVDVPVIKGQSNATLTQTTTTYSSTYATLTTVEPAPPLVLTTEPNSTLATAYNLDLVYDRVTVPDQVIDSATDVDMFRFKLDKTVSRPALLQLNFQPDSTHLLRVDVLNATTGAVLKTGTDSGSVQYLDLTTLGDGEYIAQVRAFNSSTVSTPYTLKFRTLANPVEIEGNDTAATATYLGTAQNGDRYTDLVINSSTDQDFYRFTLNTAAGRPDNVSLLSQFDDGNVIFEIVNITPARATTLGTPYLGQSVKQISLFGLPDGDYTIVARGTLGSMNQYDLAFGTLAPRQNQTDSNQVALRLDTKPIADVTLNLTQTGQTEGRLSVSSLVFTPDNWDKYQLVRVTPLDDNTADGDKNYTVTATAVSSDLKYFNKVLTFNVTNIDRGTFVSPDYVEKYKTYDEPNAPQVSILAIPTSARGEGQTLDVFRVSIQKALATDLTIGLDYDRGTATYLQDFTIDTGNTDPKTVTIKAGTTSTLIRATLINDLVDESFDNINETLRATIVDTKDIVVPEVADPGFTAKLEIFDNNTAGYETIGPGGFSQFNIASTSENQLGAAAAHSIKLATKPTAPVTVFVDSSDPTEGLIQLTTTSTAQQQVSLLFTPDNWNVSQTFYVKGVDDKIDDGNVPYKIVVSSTSDDDVYRRLAAVSYSAINYDNDTAGITVTSPQATVSGRANIFGVSLNTQPLGEIRVTMTPQNEQIYLNGARPGDPVTLTFNADNWNISQLVQAAALDDGIVEYFHTSQINFSVSTGRLLDGPTVADISIPSQAFDLGDVTGGVTWSNLNLPAIPGATTAPFIKSLWMKVTFPTKPDAIDAGAILNQIRILPTGSNRSEVPLIDLYSVDGATLLVPGVNVPVQVDSNGFITAATSGKLNYTNAVTAGTYLLKLSPRGGVGPNTLYNLLIDDADRAYERVVPAPVTISIKDNDLPTAEIISGPTASEISSQPSYFAVRLNAPAPTNTGETGISIAFKVTGGRASVGTAASILHDYTVNADQFDPATGLGMIRVAPGDYQANIGIVPIDDKLVEDLQVTLSQFNAATGQVTISAKRELIDATAPYDPSYTLTAGSVVTGKLDNGSEIEFVVKTTKALQLNAGETAYVGDVAVTLNARDTLLATDNIKNNATIKGRIKSEDVEITLLSGTGYVLPLAPNKQGADPSVVANQDPARTIGRLKIFDDDVPGVQIIESPEHSTVAEGETTTFKVSLTAEPLKNVIVTLTPSGGIAFLNADQTTRDIKITTYAMGTPVLPDGVDLTYVSLNETDQGFTAVFDARLNRVNYGSAAKTSTLSITGDNSGGTDSVKFEIPGSADRDAAGNPERGTWETVQRIIVTNLKQNSNGSFSLTVNLDGTTKSITLTPNVPTTKAVATKTLTFDPATWFVPQTLTITALKDGLAEPGEWHKESIAYTVRSDDGNWDDLAIPAQEIHVEDTLLDVGETLNGLTTGLTMLQDGLLGLDLPLLGSVGDLPVLNGLFDKFEQPLEKSLAVQEEVTVTKFQALAESALQPLIDAGILDHVSVVPSADASEVRVDLHLDREILIGEFDLSSDLGLEALGVRFATTGKASATIDFSLDIGFGWNQQFGFFLDTATTGMHMGAKLSLQGNGATSDNPNNLFTGQGSIGFLQLDFMDDPNNKTELGVTFDVNLNDLDNLGTVQFFDINGDGILAEAPYIYNVGTDTTPKDGQIDLDASGNQIRTSKTVAEPWTNISQDGTVNVFPTVTQVAGTTVSAASAANFNTFGASNNTFTEAVSTRNEGIYRTLKQGNVTIVYLDLNRDGQLNIARRNADPFTLDWNSTSFTAAEKNSSEIWFKTTSIPRQTGWKILTTGSGTSAAYFVDVNGNNVADAGEAISSNLRTKLDKDKSGALEGDVIQDGEGQFVQGSSIAFYDANGNKSLDFNEPFISYGFDDFQLSTEVFVEDSTGKEFLDLNGDGIYNGSDLRLGTVAGTDTIFLDYNADGIATANSDPLVLKSSEAFTFPQSSVDTTSFIKLGTVSYPVLTVAGQRFIDLDGNRELTLDDEGRPVEPHAEQKTALDATDRGRLSGKIVAANPQTFSGPISETAFKALVASGKVVLQENDGDRLTLDELLAFRQTIKSNNDTAKGQIQSAANELFTYQFQGGVNLGLTTRTSVNGSTDFPSFQFDLAVNIPLFNFGNAEEANDDGMTIQFKNVALDLGSFLGNYMKPILATANDLLTPVKPLIAALNADTKILGAIGLAGAFENDGKPGISLLEIARKLSPDPVQKAKIDKAIQFANQLQKLVDVVDTLNQSLSTDKFLIQFGDFTLNDLRAASKDPSNAASNAVNSTRADGTPATTQTVPTTSAAAIEQQAQNSSRFKNIFNSLKNLDGLKFNLFDPSTIFALVTGEDNVKLITYDIPDIDFSFTLDRTFRIWGPLAGKLEGGFNLKTDLSMGYDTHGFQEWAATDYAPSKSYLVFDGLYLDDLNAGGVDKDELSVTAYVGAGLGLDVGIANGFVKGGVQGVIGLDFVDRGERAGTSDGRVRGSDVIEALSTNPADLFDLSGKISAYLGAEVSVNLFFFKAKVYDKRLATFDLATFKLSAGSFSGTSHTGKVQTGTTAGATVWLDVNNNEQFDPDEPFAITDFEGNYDLVVPDDIDFSSAPIRVEGGIDVSTGLEATDDVTIPAGQGGNATAFTGLEEALIGISVDTTRIDLNGDLVVDAADQSYFYDALLNESQDPILDLNGDESIDTNDVQEFELLYGIALNNGRPTIAQSQGLIESAFGIDPTVDLSTFLHFDEARAGNALATPVIVGENNLNTLVTQIDAVLAGAAGVPRNNHDLSGVFSEATFQAIAHQVLRGNLDLTDRDQLRTIVLDALLTAEDWIINHGLNAVLDFSRVDAVLEDVVEILHATIVNQRALAASATSPAELVEFITESKVQFNGKVASDLHDLVSGFLSPEEVADDKRTDAAVLDSIKQVLLPPLVSTVHDVYLSEDGAAAEIPFTVRSDSHLPGTFSITATSSDPDLLPGDAFTVTASEIPGEFVLTIHSAPSASGVAVVTLHVTDSSGSVIEESFVVTVTEVDDPPVANPDQVLVVAGNTAIIDVLANDFDPEGDVLQVGLLSVPDLALAVIDGDEALDYTPDRTASGMQTITYQVDDGNGGRATSVVNVQVLRALSVNTPAITITPGAGLTNSGTLATGDGITALLSASIGTVVDHGDGTWSWSLDAAQLPTASQVVTISVTYNGLAQDQVTFSLIVRPPLTITSPASVSIPENVKTILNVKATSLTTPPKPLTFTITGGPDRALFTIAKTAGTLKFIKAPNFEAPKDVGGDNIYHVLVTVSDGTNSVTQDLAVRVTDVVNRREQSRARGAIRHSRNAAGSVPAAGDANHRGKQSHKSITPESLDALFAGPINL